MADMVEQEDEKKEKEEVDLVEYCLDQLRLVKDDFDTINGTRADAIRFYNGSSDIVPIVEHRSKATTTDMMDAVESAKAYLLETFTSKDSVVSLSPASEEDVDGVRNLEVLTNKQLRHKNPWFLVVNDFLDDILKQKIGFIKCQWKKSQQTIDRDYAGLTLAELQGKKIEATGRKGTIITDIEESEYSPESLDPETGMIIPAQKEFSCKVRYVVEDEFVAISHVPAQNMFFNKDADNLWQAPFVAELVPMTKWRIIEDYGQDFFDSVERMTAEKQDDTNAQINQERFKDLGGIGFVKDKDKGEYHFYECYFINPNTGKPHRMVICGSESPEDGENIYGHAPYVCSPMIKIAGRIIGLDFYDIIKQFQEVRTAVLRQIMDNFYQANYRRYFGDVSRMNLDDYLNNNVTNALIRVEGDPSTVVMPEEKAQLPQETFQFWEMYQQEKDYHSAVPRTFMGVNSSIMNDTARGQAQQVKMATQRMDMIARIITEIAFVPLIREAINLNIRFLTKKTSIRHLNEWIEVNPDNILCQADVSVDINLGANKQQDIAVKMQQALGLSSQMYKSGISIVTEENAYNIMKELYLAMGFKNTSDFVTDPKMIQTISQFTLAVAQGMMQMGMQNPQMFQMAQKVMQTIGEGKKFQQMMQQMQQQMQSQQAQQTQMIQAKATANQVNNELSGGSFPNQQVQAEPAQPEQPMTPRTMVDQGDYFS